jgi:hypothetical protein
MMWRLDGILERRPAAPHIHCTGAARQATMQAEGTAMRPDADDVPPPILFNLWKHHAGALRRRIARVAGAGPESLERLSRQLVVIGTELMDLYTGPLAPVEIADEVRTHLDQAGLLSPSAYRTWLDANGGYRILTLSADASTWVLRFGDETGRHVHIHPGRWSPHTRRVRANVLKTAALAVAAAGDQDALEVSRINQLRRHYLGLPPVAALAEEGGLPEVIAILDQRPGDDSVK